MTLLKLHMMPTAKPATEQEGLSDPGAAPVSPATLWDSLTKSITDGDVATRTALSATAAALTTAINSGDAATKADVESLIDSLGVDASLLPKRSRCLIRLHMTLLKLHMMPIKRSLRPSRKVFLILVRHLYLQRPCGIH